MKKLIIALSAIAAAVGFTTSANADISVAGSSNVAYLSTSANTTGGDEELAVGNTVDFSMSTTTSGGIGISASSHYLKIMIAKVKQTNQVLMVETL